MPWNMACVNSEKTWRVPTLSPEAICLSEHGALGAPAALPRVPENHSQVSIPLLFLGGSEQKCHRGEPGACAFSHGNVGQCLSQNLSAWETEEARLSVRGGLLPRYCQVPCSQIQTQELRPPQIEQKRLRKGVRDC